MFTVILQIKWTLILHVFHKINHLGMLSKLIDSVCLLYANSNLTKYTNDCEYDERKITIVTVGSIVSIIIIFIDWYRAFCWPQWLFVVEYSWSKYISSTLADPGINSFNGSWILYKDGDNSEEKINKGNSLLLFTCLEVTPVWFQMVKEHPPPPNLWESI